MGYVGKLQATAGHLGMGISGYRIYRLTPGYHRLPGDGNIRVYQGMGYIGKLQATAGHLRVGISGYIRA